MACACWAYAEKILLHTEHTRNRFHRTLSIRGTNFRAFSASSKMRTVFTCTSMLSIHGTNFIAGWACVESISSLAEHTRKFLKVEYLGRIEYNFQKSRVTGPWDHKVLVSAKNKKRNIMLVYLKITVCYPAGYGQAIRCAASKVYVQRSLDRNLNFGQRVPT